MDVACIRLAVNKKIPDILLNHPEGMPITDLARETELEKDKLLRIMRYLSAKHCFREGELTLLLHVDYIVLEFHISPDADIHPRDTLAFPCLRVCVTL